MKLIRKIIFFLNIALVFITLLAYLSPFINPAGFWMLSFLGLTVPVLLFLNIVFIFYWMITEWKKSWLSIACLLLGAHYIGLTLSFNNNEISDTGGFTVASYNMNYAHGIYKTGTYRYDKQKSADFAAFLMNGLSADIFCGQESNKYIFDLIGNYYPYHHFIKETGTNIYSRFPIIDKGKIDFGTVTNSCVWADVVIHSDTVRVYSAHLQSNKISSEAERILEEAEQNQSVNMLDIRSILSKYKRYVVKRAYQARMINEHINKSPYPIILTGDFNDPPVSFTHRVLAKGRKDAFVEAGNGLGISYAGSIPMLRIDNIIVSDEFDVLDHKTIRKKYSDHYPVVAKISLDQRP